MLSNSSARGSDARIYILPGDLCDANAASDEWNPSDRLDSDVLAFSVHKEAQSEEAHTPLSSQTELGAGIVLAATLAEERQRSEKAS